MCANLSAARIVTVTAVRKKATIAVQNALDALAGKLNPELTVNPEALQS